MISQKFIIPIFSVIKRRIPLILTKCQECFGYEGPVLFNSNPIKVVGFTCYLQAKKDEEGFLGLYLHAKPLDGVKDKYRVEINWFDKL
jgi:hypothetical protein